MSDPHISDDLRSILDPAAIRSRLAERQRETAILRRLLVVAEDAQRELSRRDQGGSRAS